MYINSTQPLADVVLASIPALHKDHQAKVYAKGYRDGQVARVVGLAVSHYVLNSVGDFPLGSWSQQSAQGYSDGVNGLAEKFIYHKGVTHG